ncbi:MAG: hypothetical protein E3J43_00865 [Candidatus Heimdallarchaeota archaeon]|nr:MAG: hypothetical protein E3J43_00865 [Candidatus Heimdallarchaeota archaeon]
MLQLHNEDCLLTMSRMEDKSVNLIIADFPYFEVKGEFDFIWKDFDEFLAWVEVCAKEFKRILTDNGSLYVYGDAKKIAYKQIIFDKYFNLENSLIWENTNPHKQQIIFSDELRSYGKMTERILFYSNEVGMTGLEFIEKEYISPRNPFSKELKKARLNKGVSINQVAEYGKFYGNVNHGGAVTNWERGYSIPSKEQWKILCDNLPIGRKEYEDLRKEYEDLRKEYEDLRKEYEDLRRPFNNKIKHGEVIKLPNYETTEFKHPTIKPRKLCKDLIETSSRENDLIYIPFAGSGTEMEQCQLLNRRCIGSELEKKYCDIIEDRLKKAKGEVGLFEEENTRIQQGLF